MRGFLLAVGRFVSWDAASPLVICVVYDCKKLLSIVSIVKATLPDPFGYA
jgi:hypothetical protein